MLMSIISPFPMWVYLVLFFCSWPDLPLFILSSRPHQLVRCSLGPGVYWSPSLQLNQKLNEGSESEPFRNDQKQGRMFKMGQTQRWPSRDNWENCMEGWWASSGGTIWSCVSEFHGEMIQGERLNGHGHKH